MIETSIVFLIVGLGLYCSVRSEFICRGISARRAQKPYDLYKNNILFKKWWEQGWKRAHEDIQNWPCIHDNLSDKREELEKKK